MTIATGLDLREIDSADVYLDDHIVAKLTRTADDSISFDYIDPPSRADRPVRVARCRGRF